MKQQTEERRRLVGSLEAAGMKTPVAEKLAELVVIVMTARASGEALAHQIMEAWLLAQSAADTHGTENRWVDWPSPDAWYERSRILLRECQPQQLLALTILWDRVRHLGGTSAPPTRPRDLQKEHFVPWKELARYLLAIERESQAGGYPEVLTYENPDGSSHTLLFRSNLGTGEASAQPSGLHRLKELAQEVSLRTGLLPGQSVAFLLCDAPVRVARISFAAGREAPGHDALCLRLVDVDVSADELRHAHRAFQKYLKSLGKREQATTAGFRKYVIAQVSKPSAQPTDRTLLLGTQELVTFVEPRRDEGQPWQDIVEEWNREHPERAAKSSRSFQANFYQARRRVKKRLAPESEEAGMDRAPDESTSSPICTKREPQLQRRKLDLNQGNGVQDE